MAVNRSVVTCVFCHLPIPALGGQLVQEPRNGPIPGYGHLACVQAASPAVSGTMSQNNVWTIQNNHGRCEDAPSCGCCGEVRLS